MFTPKKLAVAATLLGLLPMTAPAQAEPVVAQLAPPPVFFPQSTPMTPITAPAPVPHKRLLQDEAAIEARVLLQLAAGAEEDGKLADAITIYKQVLAITAKNPQTNLDAAVAAGRLGAIYGERHNFPLALTNAQNALHTFEQIEGPINNDVGIELNNLAWIYEQSGQRVQAEKTYMHAISVFKSSADENDDLIAVAHNNLGDMYTSQKRYQEAYKQYQTSYFYATRFYGADHPLAKLIAGKLHRTKTTLAHRQNLTAATTHKAQK
jgi:tetratricopeptide (TPR) repeat protein